MFQLPSSISTITCNNVDPFLGNKIVASYFHLYWQESQFQRETNINWCLRLNFSSRLMILHYHLWQKMSKLVTWSLYEKHSNHFATCHTHWENVFVVNQALVLHTAEAQTHNLWSATTSEGEPHSCGNFNSHPLYCCEWSSVIRIHTTINS